MNVRVRLRPAKDFCNKRRNVLRMRRIHSGEDVAQHRIAGHALVKSTEQRFDRCWQHGDAFTVVPFLDSYLTEIILITIL